jgi:hypothetical protein
MLPRVPAFDIFSGRFGERIQSGLVQWKGWLLRAIACFSLLRSKPEHILFSAQTANSL